MITSDENLENKLEIMTEYQAQPLPRIIKNGVQA
jgi:hypothetical protein